MISKRRLFPARVSFRAGSGRHCQFVVDRRNPDQRHAQRISAQGSAPKLNNTKLLPTSRPAAARVALGATERSKKLENDADDWALGLVSAKSMISIRSLGLWLR
jgi:hypothetical protein